MTLIFAFQSGHLLKCFKTTYAYLELITGVPLCMMVNIALLDSYRYAYPKTKIAIQAGRLLTYKLRVQLPTQLLCLPIQLQ